MARSALPSTSCGCLWLRSLSAAPMLALGTISRPSSANGAASAIWLRRPACPGPARPPAPGPPGGPQAIRDLRQQAVARRVAEAVVHRLEVVAVEEQHTESVIG